MKEPLGHGILYKTHGHTKIECFSDIDWAGSKEDRRSTLGYYVFVGGNLVSWKSKKQSVVSWSSVESKYRAMAQVVCEITWIHQLLMEVDIETSSIHIASNQVFHERTKHIEIDCHFVREKIQLELISTGSWRTVRRYFHKTFEWGSGKLSL